MSVISGISAIRTSVVVQDRAQNFSVHFQDVALVDFRTFAIVFAKNAISRELFSRPFFVRLTLQAFLYQLFKSARASHDFSEIFVPELPLGLI